MKSLLFAMTPPGTKGRKSVRNLSDEAIERATLKSKDEAHQRKFLSRGQRDKLLLTALAK